MHPCAQFLVCDRRSDTEILDGKIALGIAFSARRMGAFKRNTIVCLEAYLDQSA